MERPRPPRRPLVLVVALAAALVATDASARATPVAAPEHVRLRIDTAIRKIYGPAARLDDVIGYGPFRRDGNLERIDPELLAHAIDRLEAVPPEVDAVWFASTAEPRRDPALSRPTGARIDVRELRERRAALVDGWTGNRAAPAPAAELVTPEATAWLALVRRPPGVATRVPALPDAKPADSLAVLDPTFVPARDGGDGESSSNSYDADDPGLSVGPLLGAMYLQVDGNDFLAPMYGASIGQGRFTLFLGDTGAFSQGEDAADRFRFAGLRYGAPTGLFLQALALDARAIFSERDVYTHRATGAAAGAGWQWANRHFHGSLAGGLGAFDTISPGEAESKVAFGFQLAGHAGFTF